MKQSRIFRQFRHIDTVRIGCVSKTFDYIVGKLLMRNQYAVAKYVRCDLAGQIIGGRTDSSEAEHHRIGIIFDHCKGITDQNRVVFDNKGGKKGVSSSEEGIAQIQKMFVFPTGIENFGSDDDSVKMGSFHMRIITRDSP